MHVNHYGSQKIYAAAIVLGLALFAVVVPWISSKPLTRRIGFKLRRKTGAEKAKLEEKRKRAGQRGQRSPFAWLLGKDGRLSTSQTIAAVWTLVVAYILVTLILVWPKTWSSALTHLWPTYVLFLGGPYASLVLAKAGVSLRVANGTLQKPSGSGNVRLSDLVGDDSGSPDLFDSQYVLFNLIAIIFVVDAFIRATSRGFPSIPEGLVLLTGGPAAVYLANKVSSSNAPVIFSVKPSIVRPGDSFTIFGQNFAPEGATGTGSTSGRSVEVGGQAAQPAGWTDSTISASAPTPDAPQLGALDVSVSTAAGAEASLDAAITISQAPRLDGLDATSAAVGSTVTASGQWSVPAGGAPAVRVGALAAAVVAQPIPGSSVTFTVPALEDVPTSVPVRVVVAGLASNPATLQVRPSA